MSLLARLLLVCLLLMFWRVSYPQSPPTLTIDDAVRMALANNPTIRRGRAQVEAARSRTMGAEAERLPQVDLRLEYRRTPSPGTFEIPELGPDQPARTVSLGDGDTVAAVVAARQDLYTGGRVAAGVARARALLDIAIADLAASESQLALQTRMAYQNVLLAQSLIRSAEQNLASARAQLDVATARYEAGAAARFDVLRAQTQVSEAEQALTEARNREEGARVTLNRLLGISLDTEWAFSEPAQPPLPSQSLPALIQTARQHRAEILAARAQLLASEAGIKLAQSQRRPQVSLSADYTVVEDDSPFSENGLSLVAVAAIEVFDGGRTRAGIREAQANREEASANLEEITRAVEEDVRQAYLNLQTAKTTIETARARLRQAQEAHDIAVVRYQAGVGTAVEIADALAALASARANLDQATSEYSSAHARLLYALGTIVAPDN